MAALLSRAADRALTVTAALGVVALLSAVLGAGLGVRPLVLRSGSMAPTIGTGALALAREVPARELRVGDVVAVTTAGGQRVTHRVVAAEPAGSDVRLTLRGDANRTVDPEQYVVGSAYRVGWHAPWLGYAVTGMSSPAGLIGLLTGVVLLARLARHEPSRRRRAGSRRRPRNARHRARRGGAAALATAAVVAGPAGPAGAAPWTDPVVVSGATFTATTVPAPVLSCGVLGVLSVTFTWTAVSGATSYTLHYGSGGSSTLTTTSTSQTFLSAISGGTAWVEANRDFGSTVWTSAASNSRSYTVAVVSLCG